MRYKINIKSYTNLSFLIIIGLSIASTSIVTAGELKMTTHTNRLDSIGNEYVNGYRFVIHKVQRKENYYQLSRKYGVPVNDIVEANKNKNLIVGEKVKIPRGKAPLVAPTTVVPTSPTVKLDDNEMIEYRVGKSETLYSISRRFNKSVDDIKRLNGLTSNSIRENQILKIPKVNIPAEEKPIIKVDTTVIVTEESEPLEEQIFKPNRLGIHEKKEKGVGVWLQSLSGDEQTSLALHKTAPIGTILKITNPMNESVTFAKVVGKFTDNEDTQGAIVVLSKATASAIGILDKKFQIEINYGVPIE